MSHSQRLNSNTTSDKTCVSNVATVKLLVLICTYTGYVSNIDILNRHKYMLTWHIKIERIGRPDSDWHKQNRDSRIKSSSCPSSELTLKIKTNTAITANSGCDIQLIHYSFTQQWMTAETSHLPLLITATPQESSQTSLITIQNNDKAKHSHINL